MRMMDLISANHSGIVGGDIEHQRRGITDLAAPRQYPTYDVLCLMSEPGSIESNPMEGPNCKFVHVHILITWMTNFKNGISAW
ncbi:hypothetical protein XELAEV_18033296mg [Xenopus laevis]|uniref:Uncharacterized protein n=1 Tax=Xenopus laevis TaxID=8355 RepID=A0A974HDV5_XENLA|nr:hypothetical protein XELAEV_18033296mg [Xenopus laevis]